ncbi:MAG: bifunctional diaminohydroxyphosphoribosylaminopyrimidine deaminase/5-amino-6-(5-phosphoribosylamino)uracil reductase RibD [Aquificota bacterium]|nr:bifunctional diaminohydroxyphosphoribosylaminopyrimidine deaminase/5-amino-6-(5-phosphoribosylamino)uracil reductase RibD [Aquificota bacterium]
MSPAPTSARTPPCTDALIRAGVRKVFIATKDPNPVVSGKGIEKLREEGIEVEVGLLEETARELNSDFFTFITQKRPFVTLKLAQTLDGKIATLRGESKWITSLQSRKYAHRLRAEASAVLVGINTVIRDNPSLTVEGTFPLRNSLSG